MKITHNSTHARHAIQLSATYSKMLLVVREPETWARSFDGEDSRVAVRDIRNRWGDSGQAQVDTRLEIRSSLMEPQETLIL